MNNEVRQPVTSAPLAAEDVLLRKKKHLGAAIIEFARKKPLGAFGAAILLLMVVMAIVAPWISTYDPTRQVYADYLAPPGAKHLFGADGYGRDVYSNIVWGSRVSLMVGLIAVGIGTTSGSIIGIISGYVGGKGDFAIQRCIDVLMSFPTLILAIAAITVLGVSIVNIMLAISITLIPSVSRITRGSVLSVKENQYIEAARAIGVSNFRIMFKHILPNVLAPIIVLATLQLGNAILAEASLSFLGLGTPPPTPSWGRMLGYENLKFMQFAPWTMIAPGVALSMAVLGFNLFGDAVRDVMDPRLRGAGRLR